MCTVTLIPLPGQGLRLVTNRDESVDRPRAAPPAARRLGGATGTPAELVAPTDPAGGGTWVLATDAGLVLTLLNLNPDPRPEGPDPAARRSRGLLLEPLADAPGAEAALDRLRSIDLGAFPPFRVVGADPATMGVARWDRRRLTIESRPVSPACFVSSGLGDHVVEGPRLALFRETLGAEGAATPEAQDAFHAHAWPDRRHVSVVMERPGFRTVSRTAVEVGAHEVSMRYEDDAGAAEARLARAAPGARLTGTGA